MTARTFRTPAGVELAYEAVGSGGTPLVLIHGWTGFRQDFETQWDALAAERQVFVPDLRGHGESAQLGSTDAYTFGGLLEDLAAFLDGVVGAPCHLLGHSMGGMITLRLALERPEALASLVLMNTAAAPLTHVNLDAARMAGGIARDQGMEALVEQLRNYEGAAPGRSRASLAHQESWGERYWAWRAARVRAMDPFAYEAFVHAMVEQESQLERLGEIALPTTVLVGSQDAPFLEPTGRIAAGIPDAWLFQIAGAAHQPQFEAPEPWLDAVRIHLARAEGR